MTAVLSAPHLSGSSMLIRIVHTTKFVYAGNAQNNFNEVRLRPFDDDFQTCKRFSLTTWPGSTPREYDDFYGNCVYYFDVSEPHRELVIETCAEVETTPDHARKPIPEISFAELEASPEREMQAEFMADSQYVTLTDEIRAEAQIALMGIRKDVWNDVCAIGRHVHNIFKFTSKVTSVSTSAGEALRLRCGVCQDYAHVMLGLGRAAGIPMRYASGYFFNPRQDVNVPEASHAWVEAFVPEYGWAAFDPTHDRPANERYVKVAMGRDYADIRPIGGTYRGAPTLSMSVDVSVRQIQEDYNQAAV
jgi:transglutaminase-like putative cysteine protease